MILADVGEIGIYHKGREMILRPSLYAMSRIADKHQIVNIFSQVMAGDHALSLLVIQACANEDISDIYGMYERTDKGFEFLEGDTSKNEAIIIAQSLLKHGIIGDIERKGDKSKKDYTQEFDAKSFVSAVVAHLGISEREAWAMTMTSVAGALQSKFPPPEENKKYLSEEEEEEILKRFS